MERLDWTRLADSKTEQLKKFVIFVQVLLVFSSELLSYNFLLRILYLFVFEFFFFFAVIHTVSAERSIFKITSMGTCDQAGNSTRPGKTRPYDIPFHLSETI